MRISRRSVLAGGAACSLLPRSLRGQTAPYPQPAKNPCPYSGISGPGYAVDADCAHGGWRSGSNGLAYQGKHPYPFPTQPWENYATGSAVKAGLIPAGQGRGRGETAVREELERIVEGLTNAQSRSPVISRSRNVRITPPMTATMTV